MKLQVDLKVRHFDQRRINCKMVMPQHMQIKNSYIAKSCSPFNLFYLLGFFVFETEQRMPEEKLFGKLTKNSIL